MTPPSPTADVVDEGVAVEPEPNPFPEPVCATCRYPLAGSAYGVLCDDCGEEWLYGREDERVATWVQASLRAVHGEPVERRPRWRIC